MKEKRIEGTCKKIQNPAHETSPAMKTTNDSTDPSKPVSHKEFPNSLYQKKELMKILSWNIQDGMNRTDQGLKTEDIGFSSILNASTIFCLQETKTNITLPDFECKNQPRKDSRSGGLCIGIQRTIADSFKDIDTGCQDIWLMLYDSIM